MEITVKQDPAAAIETSAADPWTFAEDVAIGDARYLVRWSVNGRYYAEAAAIEMGPDQAIEGVPTNTEPDFSATVKWDGCADWDLGDHHTCDPEHVVTLCGAVVYVQTRGLEILEARGRLGHWD